MRAEIQEEKTTSGSGGGMGNWIVPSGTVTLIAQNGAQIQMLSITVELKYLANGVWTSFNPKATLQGNLVNGTTWSSLGWMQIQGGFSYRAFTVMSYQYKLNANDPWKMDERQNSDFQKAFP